MGTAAPPPLSDKTDFRSTDISVVQVRTKAFSYVFELLDGICRCMCLYANWIICLFFSTLFVFKQRDNGSQVVAFRQAKQSQENSWDGESDSACGERERERGSEKERRKGKESNKKGKTARERKEEESRNCFRLITPFDKKETRPPPFYLPPPPSCSPLEAIAPPYSPPEPSRLQINCPSPFSLAFEIRGLSPPSEPPPPLTRHVEGRPDRAIPPTPGLPSPRPRCPGLTSDPPLTVPCHLVCAVLPAKADTPEPPDMVASIDKPAVPNFPSRLPGVTDPIFVRYKIHRREILAYALIDTGNLSYSLLGEDLFNNINPPLIPSNQRLRSACGDRIEVLGCVKGLELKFEQAKKVIIIPECLVVKNLTVPMNLSLRFLYGQGCDLHFDWRKSGHKTLTTGNQTIPLIGTSQAFLADSKDPRLQLLIKRLRNKEREKNLVKIPMERKTVLATLPPEPVFCASAVNDETPPPPSSARPDVLAAPRSAAPDEKQFRELKICDYHPNNYPAYAEGSVLLKPHTKTVVKVKVPNLPTRPKKTPLLFIAEIHRHYFQRYAIQPLTGIYQCSTEPDRILLYVDNIGETDVLLPSSVRLGTIRLPDKVRKYIPPEPEPGPPVGVHMLDHRPPSELTKKEKEERIAFLVENVKLDDSLFNDEQKKKLFILLLDHWDAISIGPDDFGDNKSEIFSLKLKPGAKPHCDKVRPLNPKYAQDLDRQLNEWMSAGVIAPSKSPWASALVPIRKKGTEQLRWAVDFRPLNEMVESDTFPLPNIEDNLSKLQGSRIFSCLDSAGAFHGIRVHPETQPLTAFICAKGSFQFKKMPFGIKSSPSCYARMVSRAIDSLPGDASKYALAYLDDIVVHSNRADEHLDHLKLILAMHSQFGMKIKLRKCHWGQKQVDYLGHVVSEDGIRMNPDYVRRVADWPLPKNVAELRSFLGTVGYYRSFFPQFGELTAELEGMKSQKKGPLTWTPSAIERFERLKAIFLTSPVRAYPDFKPGAGRMVLETDFSEDARSAVLLQEARDGGPNKFLGCTASKNSPCERNYSSNKGELAALMLGLRKFENLLLWKRFLVRTDNSCVSFLRNLKQNRGIYSRWKEELASYDFDIEHRPGRSNYFADSLSRRVDLDRSDEMTDEREEEILDVYNVLLDEVLPPNGRFEGLGEISLQELQAETAADEILRKIIPFVRDKTSPTSQDRRKMTLGEISYANLYPLLVYKHQILLIRATSETGEETHEKVVIPEALRSRVFRAAHGGGPAGHHGISRTYENLRARVFFPKMRLYVENQVNGCTSCFNKSKKPPPKKHVQHREHTGRPGARIHVDIVGPLNKVRYRGEEVAHVLTILDAFTRHLTAVPLVATATAYVLDALLENYIYVFGIPECIHSDRGANFVSQLFEGMMRKMNILHTKTPPYTPEGNRVERYHQTLASLLRTENPEDGNWAQNLPAAVFAINTAVNRITGTTPFEATFGRLARVPLDMIVPLEVKVEDDRPMEAYLTDLHTRLSRIYRHMLDTEEKSIRRETARDSQRVGQSFQVGDRVSVYSPRPIPGVAKKLQRHWHGPYIITKMVSTHLVKIRAEGTWARNYQEIDVVVDRLKKWMLPPTPEQLDTPAAEPVSSDLTDEIDIVHPSGPGAVDPGPLAPFMPHCIAEETSAPSEPPPPAPTGIPADAPDPPPTVFPSNPFLEVQDEMEVESQPESLRVETDMSIGVPSSRTTPAPEAAPFPQGLPPQTTELPPYQTWHPPSPPGTQHFPSQREASPENVPMESPQPPPVLQPPQVESKLPWIKDSTPENIEMRIMPSKTTPPLPERGPDSILTPPALPAPPQPMDMSPEERRATIAFPAVRSVTHQTDAERRLVRPRTNPTAFRSPTGIRALQASTPPPMLPAPPTRRALTAPPPQLELLPPVPDTPRLARRALPAPQLRAPPQGAPLALESPHNRRPIPLPTHGKKGSLHPPIPLPRPAPLPPPLPPTRSQIQKKIPTKTPAIEEVKREDDPPNSPEAGDKRTRSHTPTRLSRRRLNTPESHPLMPAIETDQDEPMPPPLPPPTGRERRVARQVVLAELKSGRIESEKKAEENPRSRSRSRSAHRLRT